MQYSQRVLEMAIQKILQKECQAIKFLIDQEQVSRYLSTDFGTQEEEIISIRAEVPWFDCALLILEELDSEAKEYDEKVQKKAITNLQLYYTPKKNEVPQLYNWIAKSKNQLIEWLIQQSGIFSFLPRPVCSSQYQNGEIYQTTSFTIPVPSSSQQIIKGGYIDIYCSVTFHWINSTDYNEEKFWGKIELLTDKEEQNFTREQKKQFFSMLFIDLLRGSSQDDVSLLLKNMKCNAAGEFQMNQNLDLIKKALDDHSLTCVMKLLRS